MSLFDSISYEVPVGNELITDKDVNILSQSKILNLPEDLQALREDTDYTLQQVAIFDTKVSNMLDRRGGTMYGNLLIDGSNIGIDTISGSNKRLQLGMNNATYIDIGGSNILKEINIGSKTTVDGLPITINIGSSDDIVNIFGQKNYITTDVLHVKNKNIVLNQGSITNNSSLNAGILFRDNNIYIYYIYLDGNFRTYLNRKNNNFRCRTI